MADRVKYVFEKEMELAAADLAKLVEDEKDVKVAQIQILAHNHSPWSIAQCLEALEQAPGMLQQYSQAGRLLIDNVRAVFEEFIAQELSVIYQQIMQQKQMEELKKQQDKLILAPAGTFDEVGAQREKRKR